MIKKKVSKILILLFVGVLIIISCKKHTELTSNSTQLIDGDETPFTTDRTELTKDSIYLYARQVYLWNAHLPPYNEFNPRSYKSLNDILLGIASRAINPLTGNPYEDWEYFDEEPKFSYVDDSGVGMGSIAIMPDKKMYVDLDGKANDIGLGIAYLSIGSSQNPPYPYIIRVKYVSPGSPAALKGIKRGSIIQKINGKSYGADFNNEINEVEDALNGNTVELEMKTTDNQTTVITLNKAFYVSSPIYKDTVYSIGNQNIGYLAYARFSDRANSQAALDNVFANFAAKGVNNLIVDLRYNGGGYVEMAEKLVNLIAPIQHNNKVMFREVYNQTMQRGGATLLRNQFYTNSNGKKQSYFGYYNNISVNIYKYGTSNLTSSTYLTNVEKVVFIVSNSTASASELVINSLKPYIDVQLVGQKTFGKPVGFFPIKIDKYDVYYAMFETRNSRPADPVYYSGIDVDKEIPDDYGHEFGDPEENNIKAAIAYLTTGSYPTDIAAARSGFGAQKVLQNKKTLQRDGFKGMIGRPVKLSETEHKK